MRAYVLSRSGGPSVLRVRQVDDPSCGKNQVLVKLHTIGINFAEILSRKGLYGWSPKRPYIPGMEGSGIIEDAGEGVNPDRIGKTVMVGTQHGCYAEKIAVPAAQAIDVPEGFTKTESAAFLVNYLTAWIALFEMGRLSAEDSVLVTAAAGGVGSAAVNLASKINSRVCGLTGSTEKSEVVWDLGASQVHSYMSKDWPAHLQKESDGFDVILEVVGGEVYKQCYRMLRPMGRMLVMGYAGLDLKLWNPFSWVRAWKGIPRVKISDLAERSAAVMSCHLGYLLSKPEYMLRYAENLLDFTSKHNIRPLVGKTFGFGQLPQAHAFMESRRSVGKIVIEV